MKDALHDIVLVSLFVFAALGIASTVYAVVELIALR